MFYEIGTNTMSLQVSLTSRKENICVLTALENRTVRVEYSVA